MILGSFFVPIRYPSMNEVLRWSTMEYSTKMGRLMRQTKFWVERAAVPECESCWLNYLITEPTMKRDPDNIASVTSKIVNDALGPRYAKVLRNDGWKNVLGLTFNWEVRTPAGNMVALADCQMTKAEMLELFDEKARGLADAYEEEVRAIRGGQREKRLVRLRANTKAYLSRKRQEKPQ